MKEKDKKPPTVPTDWGDVADWYDQLVGESGSEYHREVVLPGTLRLLAAAPGDHVLEWPAGRGCSADCSPAGGLRPRVWTRHRN